MSDAVIYNQDSIGGGEVMEVMMTGGDGSAMTEDTLAQIVNMLQVEGQLTSGGNHTIIIRQPGTDDIQMIQATSNDGEVVISKASAADIQTLQADVAMNSAATPIIDGQQGQVMMVDETGNLVEGVMQLSDVEQSGSNSSELGNNGTSNVVTTESKVKDTNITTDLLSTIVKTSGKNQEHFVDSKSNTTVSSVSLAAPIKSSTTTKISTSANDTIVIKVDTKCIPKVKVTPLNAIKISTVTGTQKYQAPKFHKCEACVINFVSKMAYINHMESCSKQKKLTESSNYSCVFCNNRFSTRVVLMQHVQTCPKAKESKASLNNAKLKITNVDGKIKHGYKQYPIITDNSKKIFNIRSKMMRKKPGMMYDMEEDVDNDLIENDLDSDADEKDIVYDDDEDINDEDFEDENIEEAISNRKSQKHLGPVIMNGLFKCRDCNRTFTKEHQYNRHVRACTMAPVSSRIDTNLGEDPNINDDINEMPISVILGKKKRGRPFKAFTEDIVKRPKIVSVDPKKVVAASLQGKFLNASENEFISHTVNKLSGLSDDGRKKMGKFAMKGSQKVLGISGNNLSKIYKVSPSDNLKKTGKVNKHKSTMRDDPICGLCGDKFKLSEELAIHMQFIHSDELLHLRDLLDGKRNLCSTKCPLCELHFNPNSLLFHLVTFHSTDLQLAQDELDDLNLNLLCPYCNNTSLSQDLLREHLATKHFDRIVNRPMPSHSPVAIDIDKLLKERTNGTNVPIKKQEKVLCPGCNISVSSRFFSHHKCQVENLSPSEKKFLCGEDSCIDLSFFKIDHLLTHYTQAHNDLVPCQEKTFEILSDFLEWLKEEETNTKMKYTKSVQRLKQGKLCCVWICHQFHNSMNDSKILNTKKENLSSSNLCYSRIQVETSFSMSTARYDGTTNIKYFSNHNHNILKAVKETKTPVKDNIPVKMPLIKESYKVPDNFLEESNKMDDSPIENTPDLSSCNTLETQNLSCLVQEDDKMPTDVLEALGVTEEKSESNVNNDIPNTDKDGDTEMADASFDLPAQDPVPHNILEESNTIDDSPMVTDTLVTTEDISGNTIVAPDLSDNALVAPDLSGNALVTPNLPDNALVSPDLSDNTLVTQDLSNTTLMNPDLSSSTLETPNLSCLVPVDDKMPAEVLEALEVTDEKEESKLNNGMPETQTQHDKDDDSEIEESTYVLPADIEEWRKLFELVRTSLTVTKLPSEEMEEANKVLNLSSNIIEEPVERQVEVFTKLCSLANVHL